MNSSIKQSNQMSAIKEELMEEILEEFQIRERIEMIISGFRGVKKISKDEIKKILRRSKEDIKKIKRRSEQEIERIVRRSVEEIDRIKRIQKAVGLSIGLFIFNIKVQD